MLFPVTSIVDGQGPLITIKRESKIRQAMEIMMAHQYSQLPVVNDHEELEGFLTEERIAQHYAVMGISQMLEHSVSLVMEDPTIITAQTDIFTAFKLLGNTTALIIVEGKKPVGIITNYDAAAFFQEITGGMIMVEDIETRLRQYISSIYTEQDQLNYALTQTFGKRGDDPERPKKELDNMTFSDYIRFIGDAEHWARFAPYFTDRELFEQQLEYVRVIRNKLAHFRGRLDVTESKKLEFVRNWFAKLPPIKQTTPVLTGNSIPKLSSAFHSPRVSSITLTFAEFQQIDGSVLPQEAFEHTSWWDNEIISTPHAVSWLKYGWAVKSVELAKREVTFGQTVSALIQLFLVGLLASLRESRPGTTNAARVGLQNWTLFSGRRGCGFGWAFGRGTFRTELYINSQNREVNKKIFDIFYGMKEEIEAKIGDRLIWERLDGGQASRIKIERAFSLTTETSLEDQKTMKEWALAQMYRFLDVFPDIISQLPINL